MMFRVSLVLVAILALACIPSYAQSFLPQGKAPGALIAARNTLSNSEVSTSTLLRNNSGRVVTSYRLGWVYLLPGKAEFRLGETVAVPEGIQAEQEVASPPQRWHINRDARNVVFFVAEVGLKDGTTWKINTQEVARRLGR